MARNLLGILIVMAIAAPVFGHHPEAAEYDSARPVKVTGTIKEMEWQNPQVWFYVDVKDENGNTTTWGFSGAPKVTFANGRNVFTTTSEEGR